MDNNQSRIEFFTTLPSGPQVVFQGHLAGLIGPGGPPSGDANDPYNYAVFCECSRPAEEGGERRMLALLGALKPNSEGQRSVYCPHCGHATIIDAEGQIVGHFPFKFAPVQ